MILLYKSIHKKISKTYLFMPSQGKIQLEAVYRPYIPLKRLSLEINIIKYMLVCMFYA